MKKLLSVILAIAMRCSLCVGAMAYNGSDGETNGSEMIDVDPTVPMPCTVTESFQATLNGNESLNKDMVLSGDYRYFIMHIVNTGDYSINVDVDGKVYSVPANSGKYIHSTNRWSAGTYTIGFATAKVGVPMKGSVVCSIATTLEEVAFPS